MTIHITGQRANTAPLMAAENAMRAGIPQTVGSDQEPDGETGESRLPCRPLHHPRRSRTVAMEESQPGRTGPNCRPPVVINCETCVLPLTECYPKTAQSVTAQAGESGCAAVQSDSCIMSGMITSPSPDASTAASRPEPQEHQERQERRERQAEVTGALGAFCLPLHSVPP